jgi:hypothetical protein
MAIIAKNGIQFGTNGLLITTDSYNPRDPEKSTNGNFDPAKLGNHGDVISNNGDVSALKAQIRGRVYTSSGNNVIVSSNATGIGSQTWLEDHAGVGIEPGYVANAQFDIPDVQFFPYDSALPPDGRDVVVQPGLTNYYDHVLEGGLNYWFNSRLWGQTVVVGPGISTLVLPNGLDMSGSDTITVLSNASLRIYCGGTNCVWNGNRLINKEILPSSFTIYCLPTVTSFTLTGGDCVLYGSLIAAQAAVTIHPPSGQAVDIFGLVLVDTLDVDGTVSFHADEGIVAPATPSIPATLNFPASTNSGFQFSVSGVSGLNYAVETSSNLVDWFSICTNASPFSFADTNANSFPRRFYRSAYLP